MANSISSSVGERGINRFTDVKMVQSLLNTKGARLVPDGACGPKTIQAIRDFQKTFLAQPDGRVDVGGATWHRLNNGAALVQPALVQLPQQCGFGYYSYSSGDRQYGTPETIKALQQVAMTFRNNLPAVQIGIGDMSFVDGRVMSPHQSHRSGRNVDIRPLRKDNQNSPVTITDQHYSRENTHLLVESLLAHRNVSKILFNDTKIKGVVLYAGHHNHMHVEFRQ